MILSTVKGKKVDTEICRLVVNRRLVSMRDISYRIFL